MNNVLILSSSEKVSLVKYFKKHSYKHGSKIYTADIKSAPFSSYYSDGHFVLPRDEDKEYLNSLLELCVENQVKLLVPSRDKEIKNISRFRTALATHGIIFLAPDDRTIEICSDKEKFCVFCEEIGVETPKRYTYDTIIYPCFAKEKEGCGSRTNKIIKNKNELPNNHDAFVFQELLDWDEYSIDFFCNNTNDILSLDVRKRAIVSQGESIKTQIVDIKEIKEGVEKIARNLNFFGHNVAQCFYKNGVIKMIEINTRYGGASGISLQKKNNSIENLLDFINGCEMKKSNYLKENLTMIKVTKDVIINEKEIRKVFCIDIDGTICTENPEIHYKDAKPITKVITKINTLYKNGNIIKLYTARGASSGTDWRVVTEQQLKSWGVLYHELILGKPYADYYIDNKAIDILEWV